MGSKSKLTAFLTLCMAALAAVASAELLVYEGFDYTPDTSLADKDGGTGFVAGSKYLTNNSVTVGSGSLNYVGLQGGTGNHLNMQSNSDLRAGRAWGTGTAPAAGSVYWYSFLISPQANARGTFVPFSGSNGNTDGQNGYGMRLDRGTDGTTVIFKTWSPGQSDGGATNNISFANGYGATYFVMGKLAVNEAGTQTTNTIWVNPTTGVEPTTGGISVTQTNAANPYVTRLSGRMFTANPSGTGNKTMLIDELRIGTTAVDVAPVPEPATLTMMGLGVLALLRRRRN